MKGLVIVVSIFCIYLQKSYGASIPAQLENGKDDCLVLPDTNEGKKIINPISEDLNPQPNDIDLRIQSTSCPFLTNTPVPDDESVPVSASTELTSIAQQETTRTTAQQETTRTTAQPETTRTTSQIPISSTTEVEYLDIDDSKVDATTIRNAITGPKVDSDAIIRVLAHRALGQRLSIADEYKVLYKNDLAKDVHHKLSGWFKKLVLALITPLTEYYARELYEAMYGAGTDEDALIDILCTLSNEEIRQVRATYAKAYAAPLLSHIEHDTSGYFNELLIALVSANRDETDNIDKEQAADDANRLLQAGELKAGTDESTFITILTKRSHKQLEHVFDEYKKLSKFSIEASIEREFSGHIKRGLLAIVKAVRDPPNYFAERLHTSMAGSGTNNRHLIRIVVTRRDIDMDRIKIYYNENNGCSLEDAIADDTSGEYKTCLLELVKN